MWKQMNKVSYVQKHISEVLGLKGKEQLIFIKNLLNSNIILSAASQCQGQGHKLVTLASSECA